MIHVGDCLTILPTLEGGSVHTCVTSPPYFGLRDYGMSDQIGLEPTPDEFVAALVAVFREVRRVLRDDGTVWLNMGDSYNAAGRIGHGTRLGYKQSSNQGSVDAGDSRPNVESLKEKDLIGIPWRVAFALQADGWYLRQDIIWAKPNPMPESVRDRCTKSHEYLFLLSKGPRYYFDADAIREEAVTDDRPRVSWEERSQQEPMRRGDPGESGQTNNTATLATRVGRNKRSVWTVPTMPFKEAHFATFPEALIEPCILAGAPTGGVVLDPFMGAGTTAVVASRLGRDYVGCELNPAYADIANQRLRGQTMGFRFEDVA